MMTGQAREIILLLPKQDWWQRQEAIGQLLACPEQDIIGEIEKGIRNQDDAHTRNAAMEVYRALGVRGFTSLTSLLQDDDCDVRLFAVNILSDVADPEAFPLLIAAIRDPDVNVRVAAAEGLGKIRDDRAIPVLEKLLHDEPWVAMAAVNALGEIGGEAAFRVLYGCLDMEGCRELAITALGNAGDLDSLGHLAACFCNEQLSAVALKAAVRIAERKQARLQPEYCKHHFPKLLTLLQSPDMETRRAALRAISWSGDGAALQLLLDAVRQQELQEIAIDGILQFGKQAVSAIVDEIINGSGCHRHVLVKLLPMLGEQPALLQCIGADDSQVRREVALALGAVRIQGVRQILHTMIHDPIEEVRMAVQKSLEIQEKA